MYRLANQRLLLATWASFAVVSLTALPGSAQPPVGSSPIEVDEANRLFREGREDFNAGRIKDAHRKYRAAWKLRKSPDVAANLGQTELELGLPDQAARHFAYALANLLPSTSREQRSALEHALAEVRAEVGLIAAELQPEGAALTLDGESVDPVYLQTGLFVAPGRHVLRATADGYLSVERVAVVAAGESLAVQLRLEQEPAPGGGPSVEPVGEPLPRESSGASSVRRTRAAVALTGGVLAALGYGVGVVSSVRAAQRDRDAAELRQVAVDTVGAGGCAEQPSAAACADLSDNLDQRSRNQQVAIGGYVAGGVLTVTTLVAVAIWPRPKAEPGGSVAVGVRGDQGAAWLSVAGRF